LAGQERNYETKRWKRVQQNFSKPLAMARGQRLQATSLKLQAPSRKLDKGPVLCYRIFKEKKV